MIEELRREIDRCHGESFGCIVEEFIPIKSKVGEDGGIKVESDCKDKMNWMSSVQLWSDNYIENNDDDKAIAKEVKRRNLYGEKDISKMFLRIFERLL